MGHEEQAIDQSAAPDNGGAQRGDASGGGGRGSFLKVSLADQLKEVETEVAIRAEVFPRLKEKHPKRAAEFQRRADRMRGALATLQWLARNEARIKAALALAAMAK